MEVGYSSIIVYIKVLKGEVIMAKRPTGKRTSAKRTSAKRTPAKRTPAKRAPAKRTPAKKPVSYVKFSDKLTDSIDDITKMIEDHKDMIDSVQEIALELTSAIGTLNSLTTKYAGIANEILDNILPIIKKLPIIPDKVEDLLVQLEKWTQKIIDNEKTTTKTISDVHSGLQSGDVNKIKAHSTDLQKVTKSLTAILPKK
jgi:uncharacterized phage infection (PIP) family protein YhgE